MKTVKVGGWSWHHRCEPRILASLPRCSSLLVNTGFLSLVLFIFCKYCIGFLVCAWHPHDGLGVGWACGRAEGGRVVWNGGIGWWWSGDGGGGGGLSPFAGRVLAFLGPAVLTYPLFLPYFSSFYRLSLSHLLYHHFFSLLSRSNASTSIFLITVISVFLSPLPLFYPSSILFLSVFFTFLCY